MKTYSLAQARQHLSEVVADVVEHHEHVLVTKNGRPAAVIVSAQEWEEIEETEFWRAQPGVIEDITAARGETDHDEGMDTAEFRRVYLSDHR